LTVSPAGVLVIPDDNVELIPEASRTAHLTPEPLPAQTLLPQRRQQPLFYRSDGTAPGIFAAGVRFHEQVIHVKLSSKVALGESQQKAEVSQTFSYAIEYRPAENLTVEVPRDLAASDELQFFLDGRRVPVVDLPEADPRRTTAPVRKRINLLRPRIGECELKVDYPVYFASPLQPKTSQVPAVPLVMPVDGKLTDNRLYITAPPGIKVQPREGPWMVSEPEPEGEMPQGGWMLVSRQRPKEVVLGLRLEDRDEAGSTVVERAWVQTWIARRIRQDRAVFRFTSNRRHVEVVLPEGADLQDARLMLDGKECAFDKAADGSLMVALSPGSDSAHRIEVWYRAASNRQGIPACCRWTCRTWAGRSGCGGCTGNSSFRPTSMWWWIRRA
jgi:hypothetical protein